MFRKSSITPSALRYSCGNKIPSFVIEFRTFTAKTFQCCVASLGKRQRWWLRFVYRLPNCQRENSAVPKQKQTCFPAKCFRYSFRQGLSCIASLIVWANGAKVSVHKFQNIVIEHSRDIERSVSSGNQYEMRGWRYHNADLANGWFKAYTEIIITRRVQSAGEKKQSTNLRIKCVIFAIKVERGISVFGEKVRKNRS